MKLMKACRLCVRGPEPKNLTSSPCKTCGDELANFIALHYLTEEDRIDVIGQNGNDGLHYDEYRKGYQRYEKLRKLNMRQLYNLWDRGLKGENFDAMVDALP